MQHTTAWLVQNPDSLADGHTPKRNAIAKRLIEAAENLGVELARKNVREIPAEILRLKRDPSASRPAFATFWCKDTMVERLVEQAGIPCLNPAQAVDDCDDKMRTWFLLDKIGLPQADTIPVPRTWMPIDWSAEPFVDDVASSLGYPLIGKDNFGSFGAEVFLLPERKAFVEWLNERSRLGKDCLVQRYVPESHGRDLRLYVVGGQVVAAMERKNLQGDFRANISGGGTGTAYMPGDAEISLAIQAAAACGCSWAGVDLLLAAGGPLVCEVNSNAHFTGLEEATGKDVAKSIIACCLDALGE